MIKKFSKIITICLFTFVVSCEEDFVNVESDLSGAQNFSGNVAEFPVLAYSKKTGPVQVNGLPQSYLGILRDNTYNTATTANIITEIVPTVFSKDFGTDPEIESVTLNIPYFSTLLATDSDGNSTYQLDSIFGNSTVPFKLSVYKSNYLLRTLDPSTNFEESQNYYSDSYTDLNLGSQEDLLLSYTSYFTPSELEHYVLEYNDETMENDTISRISPSMRLDLFDTPTKQTFWKDLLALDEETIPEYLTNANNFKEFFRGLIFKVEPITNDGSFVALNLSSLSANIIVDYTNFEETEDDFIEDVRDPSIYQFNFSGVTLNTFENETALMNIVEDDVNGDDNLYLRGFEGSYAVIDLFGNEDLDNNNVSDQLELFKTNKDKWLINEANLSFYVDQDKVNGEEPKRVVLYDLKNNLPIIDYFFDQSLSVIDPSQSITNYSVPLYQDSQGQGRYKLRLTEHINNILIRDSTNTKLGLFVTNNINNIGFSDLKTPITLGTSTVNEVDLESIPQNSVLNNKGTVLYGATQNVPEEKRVKFEIYYTEEN
ncbi:DUF4270 domain-containing protein [Aurantibacter sp.]|uniref:DUF4270 domain-containing protein n=1 Tax=Aurantibacter sp. TaxID=2807103 RepID=UPI0035C7B342